MLASDHENGAAPLKFLQLQLSSRRICLGKGEGPSVRALVVSVQTAHL